MPANYRRAAGGAKLPEKLKVWRVQNTTEKSNVRSIPEGNVSGKAGFKDPATEALTPGVNTDASSGDVAVGRHGNFLQWGFSAPPSQMTDAGRSFFLNCLCYIARFDGQRPEATKR